MNDYPKPDADHSIHRYTLDENERREIEKVLGGLVGLGLSAQDPDLPEKAVVFAHELPRSLRAELVGLRQREYAAAVVLSGFPIADDALGPSPPHWQSASAGPVSREEAYLLLVGCLLGEPFGWATQQDGRLIHNVLPIRGHEQAQVSSNSAVPLSWHTEDGFCEYRPDYVALLCLRNREKAVTRYVDVSRLPIPVEDRRLLGEKVFRIRSDYSHMATFNTPDDPKDAPFDMVSSYDERIAILSGDLHDPVVRLDADFMDPPASAPHATALSRLCRLIDASLVDIVLAQGDLLLIDNFRAVHGRAPFAARFDGAGRWLKRLYLARDLRRSRLMRRGVTGRLLFG